ncbi:MAG: hypothetical protein ABI167_12390 [Nitrosospira sp.]
MKFSSIFANRSLAIALVVGSTLGFGTAGITYAQYGTSGQSDSSGQGSSATSTGGATSGATKGESESGGYVDAKKRVERGSSKDAKLPDVRLGKDGKPTVKDPDRDEQGGSIGPN